jgi:hypothetical protein
MKADARLLEVRLNSIFLAMRGDDSARKRNEASSVSVAERVEGIAGDQRQSSSRPTQTAEEQYTIASELFSVELAQLRTLVQTDLPALERAAEAAGAPPTPGHLPELPK